MGTCITTRRPKILLGNEVSISNLFEILQLENIVSQRFKITKGIWKAFEDSVLDHSIKTAYIESVLGLNWRKQIQRVFLSDDDAKITLVETSNAKFHCMMQPSKQLISTRFQPVIFRKGMTTYFILNKSLDFENLIRSSHREQLKSLLTSVREVYPDAAEFFEPEHTWGTVEAAKTFSSIVCTIVAYFMGHNWTHSAFSLSKEQDMFFCLRNPKGSPYEIPNKRETLKLISIGFKAIRNLDVDAATMINGWFKVAEDHSVVMEVEEENQQNDRPKDYTTLCKIQRENCKDILEVSLKSNEDGFHSVLGINLD